jgi:hypothetical protein
MILKVTSGALNCFGQCNGKSTPGVRNTGHADVPMTSRVKARILPKGLWIYT